MNDVGTQLVDTEDMNLAVALSTIGFELIKLEQKPYSNRVIFRFKDRNGIHEVTQQFWAGKLKVDAKSILSEFKNVKARLRNRTVL